MKRTGTLTFALFVIVVLAAIFWLMHGLGQTQWGLVAVLVVDIMAFRPPRSGAARGGW